MRPVTRSPRNPRTALLLPVTTTGTWKNGERLAQFVANVIGGVFVVVGMSSYVVTVVRNAAAVTPSMGDYFRARVSELGVQLSINMTTPVCARRTSGLVAVVLECLDVSEFPSDSGSNIPAFSTRVSLVIGVVLTLGFVLANYRWVAWFCWLQLGVIIQWFIAVYQLLRISLSMSAYFAVKLVKHVAYSIRVLNVMVFGIKTKHAASLRQLMKQAKSYAEWRQMAEYLDQLEDKENWKSTILADDHEHVDFLQLSQSIQDLTAAIETRNIEALRFMLPSCIVRNKLGMDVADLHLHCSSGTKQVIDKYTALTIEALEVLLDATPEELDPEEKTVVFKKLKQSYGATALCLSGGGAMAMYHMGVIKALLDADLLPNVVSGSSGGSIAAAMLACKTNRELARDILVRDVSTRFFQFNVRWFPPLVQQLAHCVKTGFLVECADFERTSMHYFGEPLASLEKTMHYTFQDAFLKTGRHVCITVSASDVTGHKGPKKLLLNHINTPHVLLWSAVAVSCSLPGIMKGKKLMARDHEGQVVPYDATGNEWVDGSIQHDLPMETMASCFNVTNFIVSQVNPHVVPFMGDDVHQPVFRKSLFHTLESVIAADVRHRLKMLAFLGLFPKIYGHQFSSYFEQNFSGNVTLIPDFIFLEAIGVKAILNPTRDDMDRYLIGGQRAVWPKLAFIGHLCAIEKCLDRCLSADAWSSVAASALASASGLSMSAPSMVKARAMRYENWLHPTSSERAAQATKLL